MPKIDVVNMEGKVVKTIEVLSVLDNMEYSEDLVHRVVVNYLANQRQGTQSTKTRSDVSGGGKKPWRQKGTGRARHGSTRSPIWVKGGIALGPKPRSYRYRINKKERQKAMTMALASKFENNRVIVVDKIELKEAKTKLVAQMLKNIKAEGKTLLLMAEAKNDIFTAARNIENVKVSYVGVTNTYELLDNKTIVMTLDTLNKLGEVCE